MGTIRLFLQIAEDKNLPVHQMDVYNTFLHGDLNEEVYMKLPPGFQTTDPSKVCRLRKSIYSLKQVPRCWFGKLHSALSAYDFEQFLSDYSLFTYEEQGSQLNILVYVDDMIISGSTMEAMTTFKEYMSTCFKMKDLGPLKYFLGIEVSRNSMGFYLSQQKYALDVISETELLGAKPATFPLEKNHKLALSESPLLSNAEPYWRFIGRLIYLDVTRPDLAFSVHVLSQFMQTPRENHWAAALRMVQYLKNSLDQGILLHATSDFQISGWCDSD